MKTYLTLFLNLKIHWNLKISTKRRQNVVMLVHQDRHLVCSAYSLNLQVTKTSFVGIRLYRSNMLLLQLPCVHTKSPVNVLSAFWIEMCFLAPGIQNNPEYSCINSQPRTQRCAEGSNTAHSVCAVHVLEDNVPSTSAYTRDRRDRTQHLSCRTSPLWSCRAVIMMSKVVAFQHNGHQKLFNKYKPKFKEGPDSWAPLQTSRSDHLSTPTQGMMTTKNEWLQA